MTRIPISVAALAALCLALAVPATAAPDPELASGVVFDIQAGAIVVDTRDGRETFELAADSTVPPGLAPGDFVLVRVDEPGSWRADQVLIVDERVEVTGEIDPDAERAVLGTVSATGRQQLLVETVDGKQAFVVNPEKLFPPLPTPDQKVAVTYRTLEVHPPQYLATGLVELPADFRLDSGNVRVTSEPAVAPRPPAPPAPEPLAERFTEEPPALPTPARMIEPAVESIEPLPQTATPLPLLLAAGGLLLGLAVATRHDQ